MGYRNSLAKMPKHIYEKIKDLSYEQLAKKFGEDAET